MTAQEAEKQSLENMEKPTKPAAGIWYYIQFRKGGQVHSAASRIENLKKDETIMTQTENGLEPALIISHGRPIDTKPDAPPPAVIQRRANRDETEKFARLIEREKEAFDIGLRYIKKHKLPMKLIRVERFFNGGKVIFYFTADNRVDFRELVKDLVQEFRTRVEIRQIGVRHETKMIGGLGCCGRELCCSSFIKKFAPVSIKMAKAQNLSLNPAKISGLCNRLLCCLTYEYDTYNSIRKTMPKPGKSLIVDGESLKVLQVNPLEETITVTNPENRSQTKSLPREVWQNAQPAAKQHAQKEKPGHGQQRGPKAKGKGNGKGK